MALHLLGTSKVHQLLRIENEAYNLKPSQWVDSKFANSDTDPSYFIIH